VSLRKIKAVNAAKIDIIDNATAAFLRDVDKALSRLNAKMAKWTREIEGGERVLSNQRNLTRAVNAQAQIEEMLLESGYRDATTNLMKSYDMVADMSMRGFKYAGVRDAFSQTNARAIVALKDLDLSRWERQGQELAGVLHQSIMDSVVSGSSFDDMATRIENALLGDGERAPAFRSRAETIANTTLMGFDRTISNRQAAVAGIETFIYLGPDDGITRPFCSAVLSMNGSREFNIPTVDGDEPIYTKEQIEGMDNGQGLPVAQFGGGYRCRHQFSPISVEVAAELSQEVAA